MSCMHIHVYFHITPCTCIMGVKIIDEWYNLKPCVGLRYELVARSRGIFIYGYHNTALLAYCYMFGSVKHINEYFVFRPCRRLAWTRREHGRKLSEETSGNRKGTDNILG
jgi:hypothetical protein